MHWYVNYPESEVLLTPMHNVDFSYPSHLHGCFEVSFCVDGAVTVFLGGENLTICGGEAVLIPPNTVHSYQTRDSSEYYTILFSRSLLPDFAALFSHKRPDHFRFAVDSQLNRHILEFYSSYTTVLHGKLREATSTYQPF